MKVLVLLSNHLNVEYLKNVTYDKVLLLVAKEQFTYVMFHQYRIIYHLSASEHFAKEKDIPYHYVERFVDVFKTLEKDTEVLIYDPHDVWLKSILEQASIDCKLQLHFLRDINFFFEDIKKEMGSAPYKLDPLYRKWRNRFDVLMKDEQPIGGQFSFDQENRNRPPKELAVEKPLSFQQDNRTKDIIKRVSADYKDHPKSDQDFSYPVTKETAEELLDHFISQRLSSFGLYQDAMMEEEPFMVHSLLSAPINLGLLLVKDVVEKVEHAYHEKDLPLEAVEGFLRQVLGWREYIRGVYLKEMDKDYLSRNHFSYEDKASSYLYQANSSLHCLDTSVKETMNHAYNHHIQRLMIIGNITSLLEIHPKRLRQWFLEMYVDSFDWVVTPNVFGMATYADGGLMSTKPYVSSANYINKMSNYCKKCEYNPKDKTGDHACPVNALYYHFLYKHADSLRSNPRMKFMYSNLDRLDEDTLQSMLTLAKKTINSLGG